MDERGTTIITLSCTVLDISLTVVCVCLLRQPRHKSESNLLLQEPALPIAVLAVALSFLLGNNRYRKAMYGDNDGGGGGAEAKEHGIRLPP